MNKDQSGAIDQFLEHARRTGLVDQVRSSAFVVVVDADRPDLSIALQVGIAVMLDKPLLLMFQKGEKIAQRARDLAEEIVEMEPGGMDNPMNKAKLAAAIVRMTDRQKARERADASQ